MGSSPAAMTNLTRRYKAGNANSNRSSVIPYRRQDLDYVVTTIVNRMSMPDAPMMTPTNDTVLQMKFEPLYRIMLHYTLWNESDNKTVAQKLKVGVPILTLRDCEKIVRHAKSYGVCMVCTVAHEKAILFHENLLRFGLNATIEEA